MLHAPYHWIGDESSTELWHVSRASSLVVYDLHHGYLSYFHNRRQSYEAEKWRL